MKKQKKLSTTEKWQSTKCVCNSTAKKKLKKKMKIKRITFSNARRSPKFKKDKQHTLNDRLNALDAY